MKIEPYLQLGGVEIANALRTLTYLRRGQAGGAFTVGVRNPKVVAEGHGYSDVYHDSYSAYLDSYRTPNLTCYCDAYDGGPYQDPEYDQAPWFSSSRPESGDFLGAVLELTLQPAASRQVARVAGGGGVVGPVITLPRLLQAEGTLYAASRAGMAYGEAWLRRILTGSAAGCSEDTAVILPACQPEGEDGADYLRELVAVGLVDGPVFGAVDTDIPTCLLQSLSFQLVAGDPYLRRVTTLSSVVLADDPETCVDLSPLSPLSDAAAVVTIYAGEAPADGIVISTPTSIVTVVDLPAFATLVIDSSRRSVTATAADGTIVGGLDLVDFSGVFSWVVVSPGDTVELCVDASSATIDSGATVTVQQVDREL